LNYSVTENGAVTELKIEGVLDALTAPELRPALNQIVAEKRMEVVADLASLRLIDSSGVGALVSLVKRVREYGGTVRVQGLRDQPLTIFRLLRLDRVLSS
jgi:anti-sigma B factor antagonist